LAAAACNERRKERGKERRKRSAPLFGSISTSKSNEKTHLDETPPLLLEEHDLEALKVGGLAALLLSGALVGPSRLGPLGLNLGRVPDLLDGRGTGGAGELLEDVRGENEAAVGEGLAGDTGRGAVDESLRGRGKEGMGKGGYGASDRGEGEGVGS
jgi:hypothetical protein